MERVHKNEDGRPLMSYTMSEYEWSSVMLFKDPSIVYLLWVRPNRPCFEIIRIGRLPSLFESNLVNEFTQCKDSGRFGHKEMIYDETSTVTVSMLNDVCPVLETRFQHVLNF